MGDLIQFVPRSNPDRELAPLWEGILHMPKGSYIGSHEGVPVFCVGEIDTSPSETNPDGESA